jgi:small subunit ribosomal protein S17
MAEKKTTSTTSKSARPAKTAAAAAKKAATAKKPTAAKKPAAKRTTKKAEAPAVAAKATKKVSAARAKTKAARPVPARVPGRKERRGVVVSSAMDKTVVVQVQRLVKHPLYQKFIRRRSRYKAHDEKNDCHVGDRVVIMESRPLSREKCWRVKQILERAH